MPKDPYLLDPNEATKMKDENKGSTKGVLCPKRNLNIGGTCKVCETVQQLFNTGDKKDQELAYQKMAKCNFYLNVVFPSDPNKSIILELGKKAGNVILDKVEEGKWTDIAHPLKGKGRELEIKKKKGDLGYNTYDVSPSLEKADYAVGKDALENRANLDNIIELLGTEEIFKISQLKLDETLTFRLLPPWDNGQGNKRFLAYVYRHWGVTQEEIDGTIPVNLAHSEPEEESVPDNPFQESESSIPPESKKEPCFGDKRFFDSEDEDCLSCSSFKACGKAVMRG